MGLALRQMWPGLAAADVAACTHAGAHACRSDALCMGAPQIMFAAPWDDSTETSDAEGITTGGHVMWPDRVRVVGGAVVHLTCPVLSNYLSVRTFAWVPHFLARMRLAFCGPHAKPAASRQRAARWRSRLRPWGVLARTWARHESRPSASPACLLGSGTLRAFPAGPPACRPSRLLSPEKGGAFAFRGPNNQSSAPPSGFSSATAASSVAALPMLAPAKSGAPDVATSAANPFKIARNSRVAPRRRFFGNSSVEHLFSFSHELIHISFSYEIRHATLYLARQLR